MSEDVSYEAEAVIGILSDQIAAGITQAAKLQSALVVSLQEHQRTRDELAKLRNEAAKA